MNILLLIAIKDINYPSRYLMIQPASLSLPELTDPLKLTLNQRCVHPSHHSSQTPPNMFQEPRLVPPQYFCDFNLFVK